MTSTATGHPIPQLPKHQRKPSKAGVQGLGPGWALGTPGPRLREKKGTQGGARTGTVLVMHRHTDTQAGTQTHGHAGGREGSEWEADRGHDVGAGFHRPTWRPHSLASALEPVTRPSRPAGLGCTSLKGLQSGWGAFSPNDCNNGSYCVQCLAAKCEHSGRSECPVSPLCLLSFTGPGPSKKKSSRPLTGRPGRKVGHGLQS